MVGTVALLALASCATGTPPDKTPRRPDQPSAETQQVTFLLIKSTLECFGGVGGRPAPGRVVLVGVFSAPGAPVELFDSESTPGNEAATEPARKS
jgi:hypothetical protein